MTPYHAYGRAVLAALIITIGAVAEAAQAQRPNFILFIADDMAVDDCGAYGHRGIRTPQLDKLAAQGMRFDRAFLTCSSCSPSRSSIITGLYPHSTGAQELHMPLPGDRVTFVELLRAAGYWTEAVGKWHLGPAPKPKFDRVVEQPAEWVAEFEKRPRDKPFFFWLAAVDPHRPYKAGSIAQPHGRDDVNVPPYLPDVPETRDDLALYYDEISRLDGEVGRVLAALERQGAADNTFVLFISDNGRPFPRCKTTVYDSGIQTPWIVRWPARVKAGSVCASLVSSVDIAPTIVEVAGAPASSTFQGVSFARLLDDPAATIRPFVFAEHNWHDYTAFDRAVRDTRYKYVRNGYTDLPLTPPADAVSSITFQAMRKLRDEGKLTTPQQHSFTVPRPAEELYDTQADPHELRNLADDPGQAERLASLRGALDRWQQQTGDLAPTKRTPDKFSRETGKSLSRAPKN